MILFNISIPDAHRQYIHFEMTFSTEQEVLVSLQLPSWRPGRYQIQNFAKNIHHWHVKDEKGNALKYTKKTKDRWDIDCTNASKVTVKYSYYAKQLDAGGTWLDEHMLYMNPVNCCFYIVGSKNESYSLALNLPDDYKLATSLSKVSDYMLKAKDYDELADSPIIASDSLQNRAYQVGSTTFNIWTQGIFPFNWQKTLKDFESFTSEQVKVMKGFPYDEYHFLCIFSNFRAYHGVEHAQSTVIHLGGGDTVNNEELYKEFLGVSSHELFHVWNVKHIRPAEMHPYNFKEENYFRTGYIAEGITTYYGDLFLHRCGVFSDEDYYKEMNKVIKRHLDNGGRHFLSVAESSMDLWLDGYQKGAPNRKTSIYVKGAIIALILHAHIQEKSEGKYSLDDVMVKLMGLFGHSGKGYQQEDIVRIVSEFSTIDSSELIDLLVNTNKPVDELLEKALTTLGYQFQKVPSPKKYESKFGFKISPQCIVTDIAFDSPAVDLSEGDEIIAINYQKVKGSNIENLMNTQEIKVSVFRNNILKNIRIESGEETFFNTIEVVTGKS